MAATFHRCFTSRKVLFGRQNRSSQLRSQQFEIGTIGGNHGCSMASCGESNQRIILKVSALVYIPALLVADVSDKRSAPGHRATSPP